MQTATQREETIRKVLEIRDSACEDLRTMPTAKVGSQWQRDRIRDIEWANRQLALMEVIPTLG